MSNLTDKFMVKQPESLILLLFARQEDRIHSRTYVQIPFTLPLVRGLERRIIVTRLVIVPQVKIVAFLEGAVASDSSGRLLHTCISNASTKRKIVSLFFSKKLLQKAAIRPSDFESDDHYFKNNSQLF